MGSSMWGVGYNLVVARKRKLLRRYAVTPMRRTDFLLSYFFSRCCFLVAELVVLLAFGALIFGTSVRGSYARPHDPVVLGRGVLRCGKPPDRRARREHRVGKRLDELRPTTHVGTCPARSSRTSAFRSGFTCRFACCPSPR